jgi:hypothetical protein
MNKKTTKDILLSLTDEQKDYFEMGFVYRILTTSLNTKEEVWVRKTIHEKISEIGLSLSWFVEISNTSDEHSSTRIIFWKK